jgi:hypothetical protein
MLFLNYSRFKIIMTKYKAGNNNKGSIKLKFITAFFLAIAFSGCRTPEHDAVNGEGVVTYKITYAADNPYNKTQMLPQETILVFKEDKASFITSAFGLVQVVNLLDYGNNKYSSLLINSLGENLAFTETSEDIKEQENTPQYIFKKTEEKKTIAGLECNKAIVTDASTKETFEIYYYSKIKVYLGCSPFKNFNYLLMEYKHSKYGLPMVLQATNVDFSPVDTALLKVSGEYNWVDKQTFFFAMQNLKLPV